MKTFKYSRGYHVVHTIEVQADTEEQADDMLEDIDFNDARWSLCDGTYDDVLIQLENVSE